MVSREDGRRRTGKNVHYTDKAKTCRQQKNIKEGGQTWGYSIFYPGSGEIAARDKSKLTLILTRVCGEVDLIRIRQGSKKKNYQLT